MEREWTDPRDGTKWVVETIPMMGQMRPGDRIPIIGETPYTVSFRRPGESHRNVVDPEVGSRFLQLSDEEFTNQLDEARYGWCPRA